MDETGFGNGKLSDKARAIYEMRIAPTLTEADYGKYIVIDTETGEYEIDANHYAAAQRAILKRPDARTRIGARIGFRAVYNNWATFPAPHVGAS
jgi:hypothetical protein